MTKRIMIVAAVLLVLTGGSLLAMDIPSAGTPDETDTMPAMSGGLSDTEGILVGVLVAVLILLLI
ncbi:hypothetical protein ACFL4W_05520 [Planctomycetota bacterium]